MLHSYFLLYLDSLEHQPISDFCNDSASNIMFLIIHVFFQGNSLVIEVKLWILWTFILCFQYFYTSAHIHRFSISTFLNINGIDWIIIWFSRLKWLILLFKVKHMFRPENFCFPFMVEQRPGVGRMLVATRYTKVNQRPWLGRILVATRYIYVE